MSDVVPFDLFLKKTQEARPEDYPEVAPAEFERMKTHILSLYNNVHPLRSSRRGGETIDWIPFEQQPSVRAALAAGQSVPRPDSDEPVPWGRVTLDALARFGTLENFFHKWPVSRPAK